MSAWDALIAVLALTLGVAGTVAAMRRWRAPTEPPRSRAKILFPFVGSELSERALQATLRLAWAEHATVVPAYLTTIPLPLALDAPVGRRCDEAFDVFEAIEHKAAPVGVPVDGRIARGRNVRHAMRELIRDVPTATRIVVAAASNRHHDGFSVDDIAWLLRNAPGEVVVLRPDPQSRTGAPNDLQADPLLHARSATHAPRTQQLPTPSLDGGDRDPVLASPLRGSHTHPS